MATNNATALVKILEDFGAQTAFGICGGFIVPLWEALESSSLKVFHCEQEGGAANAASETSLSTNKIAISFSTAGPGFYNSIIGLKSAKLDGSKLVHIAAITTDVHDGKWGLQETTIHNVEVFRDTMGDGIFDEVVIIEHRRDFDKLIHFLKENYTSPRGFVLGVFIKSGVQKENYQDFESTEKELKLFLQQQQDAPCAGSVLPENFHPFVCQVAADLKKGNAILWNGFGTRYASKLLRQLAEGVQARVMSTPRGKGIFPETHPLYIGSTGLGSDSDKIKATVEDKSLRTVVILGTRLGELSSSYVQKRMSKDTKCYYVGLEVDKAKNNLPAQTVTLEAEIGSFLEALVLHLLLEEKKTAGEEEACFPPQHPYSFEELSDVSMEMPLKNDTYPDPRDVLKVIQGIAINGYGCQIVSEAGNSFAWTNRYLRIHTPDGYRVSTGFGAMAHYASGLIGLAAFGRQVLGVIGDGSFLMNNELATAVKYDLPAIWLIFHDGYYNMCRQGLQELGVRPLDCWITPADFAAYARSLGAKGWRVENLRELSEALIEALNCKKAAVIDVLIDADAMAPSKDRIDQIDQLGGNNA